MPRHEVDHTLEDPAIQRDLPALWEVLRAASGLVAILILAGIVVAMTVLGESASRPFTAVADPRPALPSLKPDPQTTPTFTGALDKALFVVYYLVATPAQEAAADWGEQVGAHDALNAGHAWDDRHYAILYARTEDEEQSAARVILARILQHGDATIVQVIDFREVYAGP